MASISHVGDVLSNQGAGSRQSRVREHRVAHVAHFVIEKSALELLTVTCLQVIARPNNPNK